MAAATPARETRVKKLINHPDRVVREMLEGGVARVPFQALLPDDDVVVRRGGAREVAVISGGGSGHEPAHTGYVGPGMLAAAVVGHVFTSPGVDAVLAAIRAVTGPAGALLVVKNYTGDRLNFGLAAELARGEGLAVELVVVADDVSLRNTVPRNRRRGIAGTVLVHKVAGAAAAAGRPLAEVKALAARVAAGLGTMGAALGGCTLPGAGASGFALGEHEVELGLGIHGEPGVERVAFDGCDRLVGTMVATVVDELGLGGGERVALLVNGLGGTSPMELDIVMRSTLRLLRGRNVNVVRGWCGNLLTALDMPGCSITLLPLDDALIGLLDAPTEAPAWPGPGVLNDDIHHGVGRARTDADAVAGAPPEAGPSDAGPSEAGLQVRSAAHAAAHGLIGAEDVLAALDAKAGDGDLGSSMTRAARAVLALPPVAWRSPSSALQAMADAVRRAAGGSSGPFYAVALSRAARRLDGIERPGLPDWRDALADAVEAIRQLGGARPGDRTMVDALDPLVQALRAADASAGWNRDAWTRCAAAARAGADATTTMRPRLGRASYLGDRALGVPDGGAVAVAILAESLLGGLPFGAD